MRRTSVSLPTKQIAHDPFEKPDRYLDDSRRRGLLAAMKEVLFSQSQKARWLKAAALVLSLICVFYWLSPTGVEYYKGVSGGGGQVPADDSYGTDQCTKSYAKDKPIVQYVLMIDAGSTGSRIHVYKFNNCGPIPELEKEDFQMLQPGLSSFKGDPAGAAASLDPLLKLAMESVPDKLKGCTPVAVKATAGLRMIGKVEAQEILDGVRKHLENDFPFPVLSDERGGVSIMEGSDEGVYAWITTNYLLGKIGGPDKSETAAVFDLGGGSTQIVFEPTFKDAANGGMPEKLAKGDHKYELDFGGHKFDLYQHSHLGYGLMAARATIHETLVADITESKNGDVAWMSEPIVHPCIATGMTKEIEVKFGPEQEVGNFTFVGPSQPAPAQCRNLAEKILKKDAECTLAPCSFNGVHQPSLAKTFAKEDVYVFSYFYDRLKPLGMPDAFTLREMHDLSQTVCKGKEAWDVFTTIPDAMQELDENPQRCLDLNFMIALLHTGYDMPIDREVKIAKKIKGNELGWCLGASLPLLSAGSGWECKIKEVI